MWLQDMLSESLESCNLESFCLKKSLSSGLNENSGLFTQCMLLLRTCVIFKKWLGGDGGAVLGQDGFKSS